MRLISRRRFVQRTAFAAACLSAPPRSLLAEARRYLAGSDNSAPDPATIRKFASSIKGHVIAPGSSDFDSARTIFNRAFDAHPALIVRCAAPTDVARALEFAQRHNLPLAVRGGGHSRAGFSTCDGIVVDLSAMNRVQVDSRHRIAHAEAGALVNHLDQATQRFGLATPSGGCPTVGITGLTLGGGEGFLMQKFGAPCDNLLSAKLITVDGRHVEASPSSNSDLFWAIRGGGGNFGIATSLEYRLHPVTDVLAGTLTYPVGRVAELLQAFASLVATAPDESSVVGQVLPTEKGPRFHMIFFHCGDPRHANDLLKPLRAFGPEKDTVHVMSYLETQSTINPYASVAHFQTNVLLPEFTPAVISSIAAAAADAPPTTRVFIVPVYGAITRVGVSETAFPLRYNCFEVDIMGRWSTPEEKSSAIQWVKALRDKLQPFARGVYSNQLGETSDLLVRAAYGPNYARLVEIKKKYDPQNVLHLNQNVDPKTAATA